MAYSQGTFSARRHPDLLAAVVLDALVRAATSLTLAQLATACERDPASQPDRSAIEQALESLIADGLAQRREEQRREEQSHAEQSHAEQSHAEQSHAEQSHAEQSHAEQSRAEQSHGTQHHPGPRREARYRPTRAALRADALRF